MRKLLLLVALVSLFLSGCFPIELDVFNGQILIPREEGFFTYDSASGKVAKIADNKAGKPIFARFSPDGKEVLTVVKSTSGFDDEFIFNLVPVGGGAGKQLYKAKNTSYAAWAPDGGSIAVLQLSEKDIKQFKSKMPELWIVPMKGGAPKKIADFTAAYCRWLPDSKKLITVQVEEKDEKSGDFTGNVVTVDLDGKVTPLGSVIISQLMQFDASPDGKKVLLTAYAAAKQGAKPVKDKNTYGTRLFELDVAAGTWRMIDKKAKYAFYSRDGKQVLVASELEGFDLTHAKLEVADAGLTKFQTVATNAFVPMAIGGDGRMYAGWLDSKTIFYFVEKAVYGTEGKSVNLVTVGINGTGSKNLQPQIEIGVAK